MTQRLKSYPNAVNLETIACEKYMSRLLQREKVSMPPAKSGPAFLTSHKYKEKVVKQTPITPAIQNQLSRVRPNVKQQNLPSPNPEQSQASDDFQFTDDSALVQVTVKTTNPRQRSRSTVANGEPWGQLLKQQKSSDKVSVFSNFDPLRTLHFLAKELQFQLQALLPDDNTVQQMVADMQSALKRVPPEIASTIHLQQAIDLLPKRSSRSLHDERPEKLKANLSEKAVQTLPTTEHEEYEKLQKVMEDSTVKLEASCRQMETLCEQLRFEKINLEKQLQVEQNSVIFFKKKLEDLEFENKDILNPRIKKLEEEKHKLESKLDELKKKIEAQPAVPTPEVKSLMSELKNSKAAVEQECSKVKHQLRLCAIEKEKYIAVLAVRDRQISEIRNEMTQLQEVVNEQLMELHNNAFQRMPSNSSIAVNPVHTWIVNQNKENVGDTGDVTLSTIHSNDDEFHQYYIRKPSPKDLPSGDKCGAPHILQEVPENCYEKKMEHPKDKRCQHSRLPESPSFLDRPDSQVSIRNMFNELKKTAYAIGNVSHKSSQQNVNNNRQ
ncbi:uncharacterized protein LOC108913180 [Anoplophora glabripennis]|uniref:uncharacterized protein LOC108913180 n=1 Tax=Anoplophora glabripennis TaxID=217634 RepID=UPI00087464C9|nr:uncharacterized protein LOC108913180 [Anoplophora glabripennis]